MGIFLTQEGKKILREAHYSCRNKRAADRIKAILLLDDGFDYAQVAHILMLDDETIRRYEDHYKKEGIDGLLECRYLGRKPELTKVQEMGLIQHLRNTVYMQVKDICADVNKHYGKEYSISGMTQYLHRLGFVYKKTKRIPGKIDLAAQEAFKDEYMKLKEEKGKEDKIYFADASHPQHNTMTAYGWIHKGDIKTIKANTGRERINLNGAVCLENMKVTIIQEEGRINTEAMKRLFIRLETDQKTGEIYIIVDNARYNHSKHIKEYLKEHPRVHLIYLPPYSPNLNIIERLWRYFQKEILYNKYYPTYAEFRKAINTFFTRTIHHRKDDLSSLLTDNFQSLFAF